MAGEETRELAPGQVVQTTGTAAAPRTVDVVVEPTQVRRPWKATVRTIFQMALALATLIPFVVAGAYGEGEDAPYAVAQVLVFAGTFARVMALPQVEQFLQTFVPWLAAAPAARRELDDRGAVSTRTIALVALIIGCVLLAFVLL